MLFPSNLKKPSRTPICLLAPARPPEPLVVAPGPVTAPVQTASPAPISSPVPAIKAKEEVLKKVEAATKKNHVVTSDPKGKQSGWTFGTLFCFAGVFALEAFLPEVIVNRLGYPDAVLPAFFSIFGFLTTWIALSQTGLLGKAIVFALSLGASVYGMRNSSELEIMDFKTAFVLFPLLLGWIFCMGALGYTISSHSQQNRFKPSTICDFLMSIVVPGAIYVMTVVIAYRISSVSTFSNHGWTNFLKTPTGIALTNGCVATVILSALTYSVLASYRTISVLAVYTMLGFLSFSESGQQACRRLYQQMMASLKSHGSVDGQPEFYTLRDDLSAAFTQWVDVVAIEWTPIYIMGVVLGSILVFFRCASFRLVSQR